MEKLKGKIYWVEDDFNYNDIHIPKEDDTSHAVTKVENGIIEENLIKFTTTLLVYKGVEFNHLVNLVANDTGTGYSGHCFLIPEGIKSGDVVCELFKNEKAYFLYGKWLEGEALYTWWARLDK